MSTILVSGNGYLKKLKTIGFLVSGMNPHYLKKLKELGFKTFDSWWDESYDSEVPILEHND